MQEQTRAGRPIKLTDEVKIKVLNCLKKGATYELACHYAGIAYSTFRNWVIRGSKTQEQEENDIFSDFFIEVKKAEGEAALKWLVQIDLAIENGHWQAAAWKLERRYPKDYAKNQVKLICDANINDDIQRARELVLKLKQTQELSYSEASSMIEKPETDQFRVFPAIL